MQIIEVKSTICNLGHTDDVVMALVTNVTIVQYQFNKQIWKSQFHDHKFITHGMRLFNYQ